MKIGLHRQIDPGIIPSHIPFDIQHSDQVKHQIGRLYRNNTLAHHQEYNPAYISQYGRYGSQVCCDVIPIIHPQKHIILSLEQITDDAAGTLQQDNQAANLMWNCRIQQKRIHETQHNNTSRVCNPYLSIVVMRCSQNLVAGLMIFSSNRAIQRNDRSITNTCLHQRQIHKNLADRGHQAIDFRSIVDNKQTWDQNRHKCGEHISQQAPPEISDTVAII